MRGNVGTAYERGVWLLDIRIPESYPMKSPEVKFVTRCCHPNIHLQVGQPIVSVSQLLDG